MSELYLMVTISDRNSIRRFLSFYKDFGISVVLTTMGRGTAASEILSSFGLEAAEKALQFSVVTEKIWKEVKHALEKQMKMMETILYLNTKAKALISIGMPMSVLKEDDIFEKVIAIK